MRGHGASAGAPATGRAWGPRLAFRAAVGCLALALAGREATAAPVPARGATSRSAEPRFVRSETTVAVPDVRLVNERGEDVGLKQLLDRREPVVVNFFFASCASICPVMTATLAGMRDELGREAAKVRTLSITIDPDQDSPEVLSAYAKRFAAGPGWSFLTGEPDDITTVLRAFGADPGGKFNHKALFFLRAAGSDSWVRIEGLAGAADLAREARGVLKVSAAAR